jgi:hypothetical protein
MWVENNILNYELSRQEPWTFTILYQDGVMLTIPLSLISFEPLGASGGRVTFFRRHRQSGRIIPFSGSQDDPHLRNPSLRSLSPTDALSRVVAPRFDPELTPLLTAQVNETQLIFMSVGVLKVLQLNLMNPILMGWSPAATTSQSTRTALTRMGLRRGGLAIAETAAQVGERLYAEVNALNGTGLQKLLEFARRLGLERGLSVAQKAELLEATCARFGLDVGGRVPMSGGRFLVVAKDGKTALQIAADGGVTFGRFNLATGDIANATAIRVLSR